MRMGSNYNFSLFSLFSNSAGGANGKSYCLTPSFVFVPPFVPHEPDGAVLPIAEVVSRYFVRLNVVDVPGTLAKIAKIFGDAKIGISSVIQPEGHEGASVPLILMLHDAPNGAVSKALKQICALPVVKAVPVMIRVENFA